MNAPARQEKGRGALCRISLVTCSHVLRMDDANSLTNDHKYVLSSSSPQRAASAQMRPLNQRNIAQGLLTLTEGSKVIVRPQEHESGMYGSRLFEFHCLCKQHKTISTFGQYRTSVEHVPTTLIMPTCPRLIGALGRVDDACRRCRLRRLTAQ